MEIQDVVDHTWLLELIHLEMKPARRRLGTKVAVLLAMHPEKEPSGRVRRESSPLQNDEDLIFLINVEFSISHGYL
jgi:hypothetical protein